ncbi:unnamed protein product, partial [Brenthis ino]
MSSLQNEFTQRFYRLFLQIISSNSAAKYASITKNPSEIFFFRLNSVISVNAAPHSPDIPVIEKFLRSSSSPSSTVEDNGASSSSEVKYMGHQTITEPQEEKDQRKVKNIRL